MLLAQLLPGATCGAVEFGAPLFADGMVLQQEMPLPVWGTASPGETVSITLAAQTKLTTADGSGSWRIDLDPLPAGGPFDLIATADSGDVVVHDVLVGEVWVCSGQSNMAFSLSPSSLATAHPAVRTYRSTRGLGWQQIPSEVAFWFGVALHQALQTPIGLLTEAVPGSGVDLWMGNSASEDPDPYVGEAIARRRHAGRHYRTRIAPLQPYAIRGVIWWQGESQSGRFVHYAHMLPALIRSWRREWGQGDFPFFYMQVPAVRRRATPETLPPEVPVPASRAYSPMRSMFLQTLAVPNTGMAITIDLPGGLHPTPKQPFGQRLARLALGEVYRQEAIATGPTMASVSAAGDEVRVRFRPGSAPGLRTRDNGPLLGFTLAGSDGVFAWADARVEDDEIVVSAAAVPAPATVRYAWGDSPVWANLENSAGLPAAPFSATLLP